MAEQGILNVPLKLDKAAAIALAPVIRRLAPEDYGADPKARAVDALSPLLPLDDPPPPKLNVVDDAAR